jgi:hypothetical protein
MQTPEENLKQKVGTFDANNGIFFMQMKQH